MRRLVLDANILLRAVFGKKTFELLNKYENKARFFTPDTCVAEARHHVATIAKGKGMDAAVIGPVLDQVLGLVQPVDQHLYADLESAARQRIEARDPEDWPVIAVALLLSAPIWTEDRDFFGTGVSVWTTDRVELYLDHS